MNLLFQSSGTDQFSINSKNLFQEDSQPANADVPPALPPKTGTPTRPPPPPPGQYMVISLWEGCTSLGDNCVAIGHLVMLVYENVSVLSVPHLSR